MWPKSLPYSTFCLCATFALTIANKDDTIYPYVGYGAGPTKDIVAFRKVNTSPSATGIVDLEVSNMSGNLDPVQNVLWQATLNVTEVTNLNYTDAATDDITNSVIGINALGTWVKKTQHGLQPSSSSKFPVEMQSFQAKKIQEIAMQH